MVFINVLLSRRNKWCLSFCSVIAGVTSFGLDSYFYGKPTLVQWNFFKFNVFYDKSSMFGSHLWHWYLSQGIPVVLGTHLPLCLLGILYTPSNKLLLFVVICMYIFLHRY
jgi:phosphatidylinositol glycan class B